VPFGASLRNASGSEDHIRCSLDEFNSAAKTTLLRAHWAPLPPNEMAAFVNLVCRCWLPLTGNPIRSSQDWSHSVAVSQASPPDGHLSRLAAVLHQIGQSSPTCIGNRSQSAQIGTRKYMQYHAGKDRSEQA